MNEFRRRLLAARSLPAVGRIALEELRRHVPLTAFTLFPLRPGLQDTSAVLPWSRNLSTDVLLSRFLRVAPALPQELLPLIGPLGSVRTHDLARLSPPEALQRTRFYTEFARPCRIGRQVLGFCLHQGRIRGFLCVARSTRAPPFTDREVARVETVRVEVERALARLQPAAEPLDGPTGLLAALEQGLPLPCALFDDRGSLRWASRAAAACLEGEAVRLGAARIVWDGTPRFSAWRRAALAALAPAAAAPTLHAVRAGPQPAAVRCLELETGDRLAVVIEEHAEDARRSDQRAAELRRRGLTAREADVAELAAHGYSVLNLSLRLGVAESTIRSHLKQVYRKLRVSSRAELAARLFATAATDPAAAPFDTSDPDR